MNLDQVTKWCGEERKGWNPPLTYNWFFWCMERCSLILLLFFENPFFIAWKVVLYSKKISFYSTFKSILFKFIFFGIIFLLGTSLESLGATIPNYVYLSLINYSCLILGLILTFDVRFNIINKWLRILDTWLEVAYKHDWVGNCNGI